jgi:hypothetical protein
MKWRHRKRRWVDELFSRKLNNLVTLETRSVFHVWKRTQGWFAIFQGRRGRRCCPRCHTVKKPDCVEPEIKMAGVIPETQVAQSAHLEKLPVAKFQRCQTHCQGPATRWDYCRYSPMSARTKNQRWPPSTGSTYVTSYISACIWDSNEIPTATPTFSGSANTIGPL